MGIRPAKCYREVKDRAYTRVAIVVPKKNYIGTSPGVRTRQFNMGNPLKEFNRIIDIRVSETMQLRDNALEAARMNINRQLLKLLGKEGYFLKIRIYPHHILRENKQAQGAGADRIQKGMSHPFGRPIGRACRLKKGQKIMSLLVDESGIELAKKAVKRAAAKFGVKVELVAGTDVKSIGTRPKTVREEAATTPTVKETTATEPGKEGEKGKEAAPAGKDAKGKETAPAAGKAEAGKKEAAGAKKEDAGKKDAKAKK